MLAACAQKNLAGASREAPALEPYPLFWANDALEEDWVHFRVTQQTDWTLAALDGEVVIRATGAGVSSGLARWIDIDSETCPVVEWSWRVDDLPEGADLTTTKGDDVAASLFLVFGDPGTLSNPKPVPTIRYVWATEANPPESISNSPYFPGTLRNIVIQSGEAMRGRFVTERRDLRADYERAFGEPPEEDIRVVALYTDSASLGEPVIAFYRWARVLCSEPPDEGIIF